MAGANTEAWSVAGSVQSMWKFPAPSGLSFIVPHVGYTVAGMRSRWNSLGIESFPGTADGSYTETSRFQTLLDCSLFCTAFFVSFIYSVGDPWFGLHWTAEGRSAGEVAAAYGVYGSAEAAGLLVMLACMGLAGNLAAAATGTIRKELSVVIICIFVCIVVGAATTALPNCYWLFMLARAVQGFMAAIYYLQLLVIIVLAVPLSHQLRAIAIMNSGMSLGDSVSSLIGGVLYDVAGVYVSSGAHLVASIAPIASTALTLMTADKPSAKPEPKTPAAPAAVPSKKALIGHQLGGPLVSKKMTLSFKHLQVTVAAAEKADGDWGALQRPNSPLVITADNIAAPGSPQGPLEKDACSPGALQSPRLAPHRPGNIFSTLASSRLAPGNAANIFSSLATPRLTPSNAANMFSSLASPHFTPDRSAGSIAALASPRITPDKAAVTSAASTLRAPDEAAGSVGASSSSSIAVDQPAGSPAAMATPLMPPEKATGNLGSLPIPRRPFHVAALDLGTLQSPRASIQHSRFAVDTTKSAARADLDTQTARVSQSDSMDCPLGPRAGTSSESEPLQASECRVPAKSRSQRVLVMQMEVFESDDNNGEPSMKRQGEGADLAGPPLSPTQSRAGKNHDAWSGIRIQIDSNAGSMTPYPEGLVQSPNMLKPQQQQQQLPPLTLLSLSGAGSDKGSGSNAAVGFSAQMVLEKLRDWFVVFECGVMFMTQALAQLVEVLLPLVLVKHRLWTVSMLYAAETAGATIAPFVLEWLLCRRKQHGDTHGLLLACSIVMSGVAGAMLWLSDYLGVMFVMMLLFGGAHSSTETLVYIHVAGHIGSSTMDAAAAVAETNVVMCLFTIALVLGFTAGSYLIGTVDSSNILGARILAGSVAAASAAFCAALVLAVKTKCIVSQEWSEANGAKQQDAADSFLNMQHGPSKGFAPGASENGSMREQLQDQPEQAYEGSEGGEPGQNNNNQAGSNPATRRALCTAESNLSLPPSAEYYMENSEHHEVEDVWHEYGNSLYREDLQPEGASCTQ